MVVVGGGTVWTLTESSGDEVDGGGPDRVWTLTESSGDEVGGGGGKVTGSGP